MSAYGEYYILLLRLPVTIVRIKFKAKQTAKLKAKKTAYLSISGFLECGGQNGTSMGTGFILNSYLNIFQNSQCIF